MKIPAIIGDENGVSVWSEVELPFAPVSRLRSTTAKQGRAVWGLNNNPEGDRMGKQPLPPLLTDLVHQVHAPVLLTVMSGYREIVAGYDPVRKQYTGKSRRFGPGSFFYVYGLGGHRPSGSCTALALTFPDTRKWSGKGTKLVGVFK